MGKLPWVIILACLGLSTPVYASLITIEYTARVFNTEGTGLGFEYKDILAGTLQVDLAKSSGRRALEPGVGEYTSVNDSDFVTGYMPIGINVPYDIVRISNDYVGYPFNELSDSVMIIDRSVHDEDYSENSYLRSFENLQLDLLMKTDWITNDTLEGIDFFTNDPDILGNSIVYLDKDYYRVYEDGSFVYNYDGVRLNVTSVRITSAHVLEPGMTLLLLSGLGALLLQRIRYS